MDDDLERRLRESIEALNGERAANDYARAPLQMLRTKRIGELIAAMHPPEMAVIVSDEDLEQQCRDWDHIF